VKIQAPVLVTGATGFVGGHLAEALARQGVQTRLLVRSAKRLPFTPGKLHEVVCGDVTDVHTLKLAMKGVATVFHLAGVLRGFKLEDYRRVNAVGTQNVALLARQARTVHRFVYVSSLSAAGPSILGNPKRETDQCSPVSYYGKTKWEGEQAVQKILGRAVPWTILRPGGVYGPREKDILQYFQMAQKGLALLPGDGRQSVSYVHVEDLVEAILRSAISNRAVGKTYFVAESDADWLQLIELIGKAVGRRPHSLKIPLSLVRLSALASEVVGRLRGQAAILNLDKVKEASQAAWTCDATKIRRELGWRPRWTLEEGLKQAAESYRRAGWI
jgi:nucleoside-diphosphate-sugar epimerase